MGTWLGRPAVRIAAVLVLGVCLFGFLILQSLEQQREQDRLSYLLSTNNWAVSQLELELTRFMAALDRYALDPSDFGRDDLQLRLDILWSRIPILLTGPETSQFRQVEGATELATDLQAALEQVDASLGDGEPVPPETLREARARLGPFREPIHDITLSLYSGERFQSLISAVTQSRERVTLYQGGLVLVAGVLIAFLAFEVQQSHRRARNEHRARRDAEAASKAKSTFLANMSHEFRTPLNAIMGFAEIQKDEHLGPVPDIYQRYAQDIHASAAHLLSVLEDILDMARIEAERFPMREEVFRVEAPVLDAVRMLEVQAAAKGVDLTVCTEGASGCLRGDPRLVRQMALNIISNAVKFTPAGGAVRTMVSTGPEGTTLLVRDNGPGIPADQVARLGQPFFQAHVGEASRGGSGLGLALVKAFAGMHDGSVDVESEPGAGTTVRVKLPPSRNVADSSQSAA